MNEKQKAIELYDLCYMKLDRSMSEITKDRYAKEFAALIIDEVKVQAENWGVVSVKLWWNNVRRFLNAL